MKQRRFPPTQDGSNRFLSIIALRKGSDLEKAFATAALVYNNDADAESKLSKAETKSLLQSQFWHFIQVRGSAGWVALEQPWLGTLVQGWQLRLCPAASLHGVIPSENSGIWYKYIQ